MLFNKFYDELKNNAERYSNKGNHYICKIPESDLLNYRDKLFDQVTDIDDLELDKCYKEVLDRAFYAKESIPEINLVFSGKVMNSSICTMKQWLLKALSSSGNLTTRLIINKKLTQIKHIVDNLFTVATSDGSETERCCLRYSVIVNADERLLEDVIITPEWYDQTFSFCSLDTTRPSYKIFSVVSENVPNQSTKALRNVLKEIGFSETDIDEIFNVIQAITELSQFTVEGNKKTLEFTGISHFRVAAKILKMQEQELHDFLVQEYIWKDSKKKLNTAKNINRDIRSFLFKLYEHVVWTIFELFNAHPHNSTKTININIIYTMSMPCFNERQMYSYGDFLQYSRCSKFHSALSKILSDYVTGFAISTNNTALKNVDKKEYASDIITAIFGLLVQCKGENNQFEYLKKSEKNLGLKVRFTKDPILCAQIFVDEYQIYVKFDWQNFVDNCETYDVKRMKSFFKVSSNSLFKKYQTISSICFNPEMEKLHEDLVLSVPLAINTFIVHTLVVDDYQMPPKYDLSKQITNGRLEYLAMEELCSIPVTFKDFVSAYQILFLKHDDTNTDSLTATKHAIKLLKLDKAWCSQHYVHLQSRHLTKLEMRKENYIKSVITAQCLLRRFISKSRLRNLKKLAENYKEIYRRAIQNLRESTDEFISKYAELCKVDLEQADLHLLEKLQPSFKETEERKVEPFQWMSVLVMNGSNVLGQKSFDNCKFCVHYSRNEPSLVGSESFDIASVLPHEFIDVPNFIMKVEMSLSGDVFVEFKSSRTMYVWNVNSEIGKEICSSLSMSSGMLYPSQLYRLFSFDYMMTKIAYSVIRRTPYPFKHISQESSFSIIINDHQLYQKSLTRAPIWLHFVNHFPICNLSSPTVFTRVENLIKKIDKRECKKFVKGPSTTPKVDWLTEDVYLQLLLMSLENERRLAGEDEVDFLEISKFNDPRQSIESNVDKHWSKINYKLRKYMFKNFNN